jgi:iron complex outermembrane receptor protein
MRPARAATTTSLLALAAALSSTAGAEEPASSLPIEVQVTGRRRPDPGTAVSVVGAQQIERLGTPSVAQTLERLPSINGGSGMRGERIFILRGFDQRQIAVFVDGVPVSVPYDGQIDLDKIPVDMIARVAVVKGATSLLYGPNGLGGAVSIITREPEERLSLRTWTELSPFSAARSSVVASARVGPVGVLAGAGFEGVRYVPMSASFVPTVDEDGGRRNNSDRVSGDLAAKVVWDIAAEHRLSLSFSRFEGRYGVPPAVHDLTVREWRWTDWNATTIGLSHSFRRGRLHTEEVAYASLVGNTLDSYDDQRYATQDKLKAFHSVYDEGAAGGFVRTTYTTPVGTARSLVLRTWTGLKHDMHAGQADRGADSLRATTTLVTTALQGEIDVVPRFLLGSAGVQLDGELPDAPASGPKPRPTLGWGPTGSLTCTPAPAWTITAGVAVRTRFPTLRERFSTVFGTRDPNPLLRPERAVNLSLDVAYKPLRSLRIAASVFDSELSDLITSVYVGPGTDQMQNAARARFVGGEAEVGFTLAPWVDVLAGFMILHAKALDAADDRLAYRPDNKGLVMITVTPLPGVALTGVMRAVGGQDFQNPDTGRWGHLGAHQLFDARLEWAFLPCLRAWVRMTNLTDVNVEGRYSFPEAGRQVFVGLGSSTGT